MRTVFIVLLAVLCAEALLAQARPDNTNPPEIVVETAPKAVTVFRKGAQITRQVSVSVPAGVSRVVFTGLEASLVTNSVQVSGEGEATLLGVRYRENYSENEPVNAQAAALEDSLQQNVAAQERIDTETAVLNQTLEMLRDNMDITRSGERVTAEDIKAYVDYYQAKMTQLLERLSALKQQKEALETIQDELEDQLDGLDYQSDVSPEVIAVLDAQAATSLQLQLQYVVTRAGWRATYDANAPVDLDGPLSLAYRAEVFNRTGVEWSQVQLTLSTADAHSDKKRPDFYSRYATLLNGREMRARGFGGTKRELTGSIASIRANGVEETLLSFDKAIQDKTEGVQMGTGAEFTQSLETTLGSVFQLEEPYTISSWASQTVTVKTAEVAASYQHYALPSSEEAAFLVAYIPDWEQYEFVAGEMNVYLGQTFVNKTYLNPNNLADTLELSLGHDQNVIVRHRELKDAQRRQFIGGNRKDTHLFEITLRNTKQKPITILVEEALPISEDARISVSLKEDSNAEVDPITGKLTWRIRLRPGRQRKLRLGYELRYPSDEIVNYYHR